MTGGGEFNPMREQSTKERPDPWADHGYLFLAILSPTFVALVWLFAALFDVPADVPLKEALGLVETIVFFLWLGVCAVVSYIFARVTSSQLKRLFRYLFARR